MKNKKLLTGVFAALIIPMAVYIIFILLRPSVFFRADVIYLLLIQSLESVILGWGMSFGMISGNMDMSLGAEVTLGAIVGAIAAKYFGIPGIVIGALGTTVIVGSIKSMILRIIKTSSMVISIAYCLIIGALGSVFANGISLVITPEQTMLGQMPWNIIIFVALGTAMYYLHKYSIFGANCRAIGGNAQLSKNAGIDKYKVYGKGFLIASVYAGFSGIISLSRGAGTAAATGLQSMQPLFGAMIGVFIGMMLTKWVNVVFGIVSGIMTMNIIGYGLLSLGIQPDIKNTITGAFLITLMVVMEIRDKKAQEKTERELFEMQKEAKANKKAQLVNTAADKKGEMHMLKERPLTFPQDKTLRVILDTDCYNECDDQFCVAHALMTPRFDIKAIIAEQYGGVMPNPDSEQKSYDEICNIVRLMGLEGEVNILHGCKTLLPDTSTPVESEGSRFIIEEALRDDPRPLFVCTQGAVTNLASALLMKPEIAERITVISILGSPYPQGGFEFNQNNDINAARVLYQSKAELWQVPSNVYTTMKISYFEMMNSIYPCGEIGKYLVEYALKFGKQMMSHMKEMEEMMADSPMAKMNAGQSRAAAMTSFGGELWSLGDSPCVGLMMNSTMGRFHYENAPTGLSDTGEYLFEGESSRQIRVYDDIDSHFILNDMIAKLKFYFG